jgi:hypothetical protein
VCRDRGSENLLLVIELLLQVVDLVCKSLVLHDVLLRLVLLLVVCALKIVAIQLFSDAIILIL